ncbi:hypothetical protein M3Y95_01136900 [Aphelenchoides besseyi]|nr:hypothetical protein M3Y95_01136900 [Aphelenchoides besseyi]
MEFDPDMSILSPAEYGRFYSWMVSVNYVEQVTRSEFLHLLASRYKNTSPEYEYLVDEYNLMIRLAKIQAKYELAWLKVHLSQKAYELAKKIYENEINDNYTCMRRTDEITRLIESFDSTDVFNYQSYRKHFEAHFNDRNRRTIANGLDTQSPYVLLLGSGNWTITR